MLSSATIKQDIPPVQHVVQEQSAAVIRKSIDSSETPGKHKKGAEIHVSKYPHGAMTWVKPSACI